MTTVEEKIIDYLDKLSNGLIKLRMHNAAHIIQLVEGSQKMAKAPVDELPVSRVELFTYVDKDGSWKFIRWEAVTDNSIAVMLRDAMFKKPVENCYRFDCFMSDGSTAKIYTVNPALFK